MLSLPFCKGLGVSRVNAFTKALSASGSSALALESRPPNLTLTLASLEMKCHTNSNGKSSSNSKEGLLDSRLSTLDALCTRTQAAHTVLYGIV